MDANNNEQNELKGVVVEKKFTLGCGIFFIVFFGLTLVPAYYHHLAWLILGIAAAVLGVFCILSYFNYKIEFDKDGFTYSNIGKKPTRFLYSEITKIDDKKMDWKMYVRGEVIKLDHSHDNREIFVAMANGDYESIPKIKQKRKSNTKEIRKKGAVMLIIGLISLIICIVLRLNNFELLYLIFLCLGVGSFVAGVLGVLGVEQNSNKHE